MPFVKCLMSFIFLVSWAFSLSFTVQAKTLVLVHGYLSDGMSWRNSGFTQPLLDTGWKDGGGYGYSQQSIYTPSGIYLKGDVFFSVELPSQAPIQVQERLLSNYLFHLYSQRLEPITLVGHSAGGVVSRLYVLDPAHQPVNGLITIASPNLGTPTANIAYLVGNSPLGMIASMVGGEELQNSRGLFSDLAEERPYNFLYQMNRQPHPDIHYASIIRVNKLLAPPENFDFIVPPSSQNLNNVWALRNRSGVAKTTDGHILSSKDGFLTVEILNYVK